MSQTAQEKLQQALLVLLDNHEFSQLSVSKICQTAGVHRSTFYNYYDNQFDLLEETQSYLTIFFKREFARYQEEFSSPKEYDSLVDSYYLVPYLHFIREHQKLYMIYLKHPLDFQHAERDETQLEQIFRQRYQQKGIVDQTKIHYMAAFYVAGLRQIIYQWVYNSCQDEIEDLIAIIHTVIF